MRNAMNMIRCGLVCTLAVLAGGACASHSHKSVRTYDYREDDDSQKRSAADERAPKDELTSEYQMVSPGEMAAPGKPVVNPR